MRRWLLATSLIVAMSLYMTGHSEAQADSEKIRQLEQQLQQMQQELKNLREKQDASQVAIEKRDDLLVPLAKKLQDIKIGASITVRYDITDVEDEEDIRIEDGGEIEGFRTRDRFWLKYEPDGPVQAGIRLTTGGRNPTSPFVRLGDVFRDKQIELDQFYLTLHAVKLFDNRPLDELPFNASITLGKMENPFWLGNWGGWTSEMIWDADVHPEGMALQLKAKPASFLGIESNTAYFIIEEVDDFRFAGLTGDTYMVATQLKLDIKPGSLLSAGLAFAFYDYERLNAGLRFPSFGGGGAELIPGTSAILLRNDSGLQRTNNQINFGQGSNGFLEDRFQVINATGQLHFAIPGVPSLAPQIYLVGDYINNLGVERDEKGYGGTIGIQIGKLGSGFNPMQFWFTYRDVDNDATLATFADSDLGAGTGYKGFEVAGNYRIHRNLLLQILYTSFDGFPDKDNEIRRLFLDVVATF